MLSWLQANIGSILVICFLLVVVALIIRGLIRDKKAGKHICGGSCGACGGGCAGCANACHCHKSYTDI